MQQAITIKLRLVEDVDMADFQRQFNNVLHYAYNRALEGVGKYDVFAMLQGLRNVEARGCEARLRRCQVVQGEGHRGHLRRQEALLRQAARQDNEGAVQGWQEAHSSVIH